MNHRALRVRKGNARRRRKLARDRRTKLPPTTNPHPRGWSLRRQRRKALQLWRRSRHIKLGPAWLRAVADRWSVKPPEIEEEE